MKKLSCLFSLLFMLVAVPAMGFPSRVHTTTTDNHVIMKKGGLFYGMIIRTDGTNALTVNVYDNIYGVVSKANNSTELRVTGPRVIPKNTVITTSASDRAQVIEPPNGPVAITKGLVVRVKCTTCDYSYSIYYSPYAGENRFPYPE